MQVHLVSYATPDFEYLQDEWVSSCKKYGLYQFHNYKKPDLEHDPFYKENIGILSQPRGAGYWLWKPFFIMQVLQKLNEGDLLFYADSGCRLIANPKPLLKLAQHAKEGIVAFDARPEVNAAWTKRDAFIIADLDSSKYWQSHKVIATTMLFRKTAFTLQFVMEWLQLCQNDQAITDTPNQRGENLPSYVDHRWDQALFSLLIAKHGIETYRNPSIWGNFLKMPRFRVKGEPVFYPYKIQSGTIPYSDTPQINSPYGTLFEFNRKNFYYTQPMPVNLRAKVKRLVAQILPTKKPEV